MFVAAVSLSGCGDSDNNQGSAAGSDLYTSNLDKEGSCMKYAKNIIEIMGQQVRAPRFFASQEAKDREAAFEKFVQDGVDLNTDSRQAPVGFKTRLNDMNQPVSAKCYTGSNAEDFCKKAIGFTTFGSFADKVKSNCWDVRNECDKGPNPKVSIHLAAGLYRMCIGLIQ